MENKAVTPYYPGILYRVAILVTLKLRWYGLRLAMPELTQLVVNGFLADKLFTALVQL